MVQYWGLISECGHALLDLDEEEFQSVISFSKFLTLKVLEIQSLNIFKVEMDRFLDLYGI